MRLITRGRVCQGGWKATLRPAAIVAIAIGLALSSGSAVGRWSANGDFEPDTPQDLISGRNWRDPDTSPSGMKVYFDAVYIETTTGGNPNVGALGSRYLAPTALTFGAFLGVWKDCNRDSYIGHVESAFLDYNSALLTDASVCPDGSAWNRAGMVSEFIHFAPRAAGDPNVLPRVITDREARVWGDFSRPDIPAIPDVACVNANAPVPRGTLDSTGGILLLVDCNLDYNVARAVTEADAALGLGLGFDGEGGRYRPDQDCDNPLNVQLDLYGDSPCNPDDPGLFEAGTRHRMVTVWDCAARDAGQKFIDVRDPTAPTGERGDLSYVPDPQTGDPWTPTLPVTDPTTNEPVTSPFNGQPLVITGPTLWITDEDGTYGVPFPRVGTITGGGIFLENSGTTPISPNVEDTDGSLEDTRAHLGDGAGSCAGAEGREGIGEPLLNGDFPFDPLRGKRRTDFNLSFQAPVAPNSNVCLVGVCTGNLVGLPAVQMRGDTPWGGGESYGPPFKFVNGIVRRDNLAPVGSNWFTFYALVGSGPLTAGVQLANPSYQTYGLEPCGGATNGVRNGWDCDASHWWNTDYGEDDEPGGPRPGWRYQLRDTDCLDGNLGGGLGMFASLAPLSPDAPCPVVG